MILTYFLLELISAFDNPVPREENSLHYIFLSFFLSFSHWEHMAWRLFLCTFPYCVSLAQLSNVIPGDTLRSCDLLISAPLH